MIQDGTGQMTLASQLPQTLLIVTSPPGQAHVFKIHSPETASRAAPSGRWTGVDRPALIQAR